MPVTHVSCTRLSTGSIKCPDIPGTLRRERREGMAGKQMRRKATLLAAAVAMAMALPVAASAEMCTTQSQMAAADRDGLKAAATGLAAMVQAGDVSGLRASVAAEYAKDFTGIGDVVGGVAPKIKGGTIAVEQVYLLDASQLKRSADGSFPEAQFFCTLNKSAAEADFLIPGLDVGRYAFVIVEARSATSPWRLSFLLRQEQGKWAMAGFYPKPMWAAGHDGVWYWKQARAMALQNEHWNGQPRPRSKLVIPPSLRASASAGSRGTGAPSRLGRSFM